MSFGICPLSMVPLRQSHSERSPILSQLLFGDMVEILDSQDQKWVKVHCQRDHLVGWVMSRQLKAITPSEYEHFSRSFAYVLDLVHPVMASDHMVPVTMGARLPDFDGMRFSLGDCAYTFSGQAVFPGQLRHDPELLLKLGHRYLHAPCLRGGRSPFGVDCGGLVQLLYGLVGISLPAVPEEQVHVGETIDFVDHGLPGDLAFFEDNFCRISHVGMVLPENRILHAFGQVRIDKFDHFGIFEPETGRYPWRLRLIKRHIRMAEKRNLLAKMEPISDSQAELFPSGSSKSL